MKNSSSFRHPLTISGLSAFAAILGYTILNGAILDLLPWDASSASILLFMLGGCFLVSVLPIIFPGRTFIQSTELIPSPQPSREDRKEELRLNVLHNIENGILIISGNEEILFLNNSAEKLLTPLCNSSLGVSLMKLLEQRPRCEIFRPSLTSAIRFALRKGEKQTLEIRLPGTETVVQAHISPIDLPGENSTPLSAAPPTQSENTGLVVILHDVTNFKRLESMRKEFVANVSHELKTPITSIKGFVETLLDGALNDRFDTERFLSIIARQADRLSTIIEDLLSLSRLEQDGNDQEVTREQVLLHELVERAVQGCILKADEKKIVIVRDLPRTIELLVNPPLIEQAILNLLDNGIKYSKERSLVQIFAECHGPDVVIKVIDSGIGIPEQDLPRIFERFYRVDRARSRSMGGTGLGLAIVKHIAQVHGGRVEVQSTPDKGSIFSLFLPCALVVNATPASTLTPRRQTLARDITVTDSRSNSSPKAPPSEVPPPEKLPEPTRVVENI